MRHHGGSGSSVELIARLFLSGLAESNSRRHWRIGNDIGQCSLCGLCEDKCHVGALTVSRHNRTWKLNNRICNHCLNCVMVCPKRCLKQVNL